MIPLCFLGLKARVLKDGREKSTTETDPTRAKLTGRASVLSEEEERERASIAKQKIRSFFGKEEMEIGLGCRDFV